MTNFIDQRTEDIRRLIDMGALEGMTFEADDDPRPYTVKDLSRMLKEIREEES